MLISALPLGERDREVVPAKRDRMERAQPSLSACHDAGTGNAAVLRGVGLASEREPHEPRAVGGVNPSEAGAVVEAGDDRVPVGLRLRERAGEQRGDRVEEQARQVPGLGKLIGEASGPVLRLGRCWGRLRRS